MPVMKREEWSKLSPRDKLLHRIQRNIDRAQQLQDRYNRGRASGRIADPIAFLEPRSPESASE